MLSIENATRWRDKIIDNKTFHDPSYYGAHYDEEMTPGTTHLSLVGPEGDAVALTSTVNLHFGCKIMTKHGIVLNNEMDDFSSPNITNAFGIAPSPANFIVPGKRPLSSSTPTIVLKDDRVVAVAGASGGSMVGSLAFSQGAIIQHYEMEETENVQSLHWPSAIRM